MVLTKNEKFSMGIVEIAKQVRKHLKEVFPTIKFSVRTKKFSGGQSLRVDVKNCSKEYLEYVNNEYCEKYVLNDFTRKTIERIIDKYRFVDSDPYTDYYHTNFYCHIELDYDFNQQLMEELQ